jgi:hypothetical protein
VENVSELEQVESSKSQTHSKYDEPFERFPRYQFSTQRLARLLILRGEVLSSRQDGGRFSDDLRPA